MASLPALLRLLLLLHLLLHRTEAWLRLGGLLLHLRRIARSWRSPVVLRRTLRRLVPLRATGRSRSLAAHRRSPCP